MKNIKLFLPVAAMCMLAIAASAEPLTGRYGRSPVYDIGNPSAEAARTRAAAPSANPATPTIRDCSEAERGTRSHRWPQYEIGNAGRPGCPPAAR